jgi:hypothetical protein
LLEAYHFAIGSILGDGGIPKGDNECYIEWEQNSPTFVYWKLELCLRFGLITSRKENQYKILNCDSNSEKAISFPFRMKVRPSKVNSKKKIYRSFYLATRSLFSSEWRSLFYKEKNDTSKRAKYRKCIPANIADYFWGDLALAIWFLDDGWFHHKNKTACFSLEEWPIEECEYLKDCLKTNFGLDTHIMTSNNEPHHIYVLKESYSNFYNRVKPFINDDFRLKYPRYFANHTMKNKII